VDLSGIIFVLLAVAWAVFLIPKALKHHDEVARTRSIDRFSESTRVLARREPVNDRDTRLVVTPTRVPVQRSTSPDLSTARPAASPSAAARPSRPVAPAAIGASARPVEEPLDRPAMRASARAAARRRRRILGVLLLAVLGTAAAVLAGALPWWTVAGAGGLTVVYLVLCRTQVKHEVRAAARPSAAPAVSAAVEGQAPVAQAPVAHAPVVREPVEDLRVTHDGTEDTTGISFASLQEADPAAPAGSLWDPLPVTLPTYVTKPKARRTVRTIDLGEPGAWSSGRTVVDAAGGPAPAAAAPDQGEGEQRAVGS
jgi:hypothetical protein